MQQLSVIFIGTGGFGVPTLNILASDQRFNIPFVITGQDKSSGRGLKTNFSPVKNAAIANKLIVRQPKSINELKQDLIQAKPDYFLVVAYGEIIKKDILDIALFGSVNIHASLLPKYRGASPIQEAILHNDSETGITWIKMNEKMDAGEAIKQITFKIESEDTYETLSNALSDLAAKNTAQILIKFSQNKKSLKQNEDRTSYCRKIKRQDGFIDVYKQNAEEITRKIRAYTPWPGCWIFLNGKRLKIIQATIGEQKISSGEIRILDKKTLGLGTVKGTLLPLKVQPESKREMSIEEFLRGQRIKQGK